MYLRINQRIKLMCNSVDNTILCPIIGQPPLPLDTRNNTPYKPPSIGCHYSQVPITVAHELMGHFIGIDGRVLKAINKRFRRQGCLYIWFNNDEHYFEVYTRSHETALDVRQALLEREDLMKCYFPSLH